MKLTNWLLLDLECGKLRHHESVEIYLLSAHRLSWTPAASHHPCQSNTSSVFGHILVIICLFTLVTGKFVFIIVCLRQLDVEEFIFIFFIAFLKDKTSILG